MITQNKRLIVILLTAAFLLLIPIIAMSFTEEVKWSLFDFVVAGVLLFGTGILCELVMRKTSNTMHRIALFALVLGAFALIWLELAVGIFGTPFAGQ